MRNYYGISVRVSSCVPRYLLSLGLVLLAFCGTATRAQNAAQAPAKKAPASATVKKPTGDAAKSQADSLANEAAKYEELLKDPDVQSDPDISMALYVKWAEVTCRGKKLKLQQLLGSSDTEMGASVYRACMDRLGKLGPAGISTVLAQPNATPPATQLGASTASSASQCAVNATAPQAVQNDTKYSYTVQCKAGVQPKALTISIAQAKPTITDAQGRAFALGFTSALGLDVTSYDPSQPTVAINLPPQAGSNPYSHTFDLQVPSASTTVATMTYYIASGNLDATKCAPGAFDPNCSTGAIVIPVPKAQPVTTCPNTATDSSVETPALDAITVGAQASVALTGSVSKAAGGTVQLCLLPAASDGTASSVQGKLLGIAASVGKDGKFSVPLSNSSSPYPKSGDKVRAQYTNASGASGPASAAMRVDSCSAVKADTTLPAPTLTFDVNKNNYLGALPGGKQGDDVRICVNDLVPASGSALASVAVGSDGTFAPALTPKPGDVGLAQKADDTNKKYGPLNNGGLGYGLGKCSSFWTGDFKNVPTLQKPVGDSTVINGSFANQQSGMVRICVGDYEAAVVPIKPDGTFTAVLAHTPKQRITAQLITGAISDFPRAYGPLSAGVRPGFLYSDKVIADFVGGVEQSGFSSQISNTNGFLSAFIRSRYYGGEQNMIAPTLWGRIRLLSGPLPSATATSGSTSFSFVGALTNPTGTITSSNLANVGEVVDYVFGPEIRIRQRDREDESTDRFSFIADVGATTPLASSNIQFSLQAPTANTQQCQQLLTLYPTYFTNISTTPGCQLGNLASKVVPASGSPTYTTVSTLSFAPIDRTNFLVKYGAGLRFTHIYPAKNQQPAYSGSVDFLIGQDESITGGRFHGAVFRVEGVYPLAFGASGYLYMFGSASMKFSGNTNSMPLVLGTASAPTLPLAPSVVVLPLQQPNRDFYRFGVGLNLAAIFCKLSTSTSACGASNANADQSGTSDNATGAGATKKTTGTGTGTAGGSAGGGSDSSTPTPKP